MAIPAPQCLPTLYQANLKNSVLISDDETEKKRLSAGVIVGIVLGVVFLVIIVIVAVWYLRSRKGYYRGKSISYYKDMTTKPLEEDFDDDEATKVFDDRGSREKVEFA